MCAARFTVKVKSPPSHPFPFSALLLPMLVRDACMACAIGRQLDSAPDLAVLHVRVKVKSPPSHPFPFSALLLPMLI
jgi:hypothetical protein